MAPLTLAGLKKFMEEQGGMYGLPGVVDTYDGAVVGIEPELELKEDERILVNPDIYAQLFRYANAVRSEISGFGKVESDRDGNHTITKVVLIKQVCGHGHTVLNSKALTNFYMEVANRGENPGAYNLWWHSHYDMGAFWSATDEDTIKELSANGKLFSICINQLGNMVGRRDKKGVGFSLNVVACPFANILQSTAIKKEVKEKVSIERYIKFYKVPKRVKEALRETDRFFKADGLTRRGTIACGDPDWRRLSR